MTTTTVENIIHASLPEPFDTGRNRLNGVTDNAITIDPAAYFFRYENPTWLLCDWQDVKIHSTTPATQPKS